MSIDDSVRSILDHRLVAILRSDRSEELIPVCGALYECGIRIIEITMTVPGALEIIAEVHRRLGSNILLGAGTVLDSETVQAVVDAGADFVVSPIVDLAIMHACQKLDKLVMPGAFTPTEIQSAHAAGAKIVKVFPANVGGPDFLKAIHGPFPEIQLLPTGGIDLGNMIDFLDAGACAVGVGNSLLDQNALINRDWDALRAYAEKYVQKVQDSR